MIISKSRQFFHDVVKFKWCADLLDVYRMSEFAMKLTDIDIEQVGIPETEYSAIVKMPSSEFSRVCRDLSNFGESVTICVTKDGLKFSVKGDSSNGMCESSILAWLLDVTDCLMKGCCSWFWWSNWWTGTIAPVQLLKLQAWDRKSSCRRWRRCDLTVGHVNVFCF